MSEKRDKLKSCRLRAYVIKRLVKPRRFGEIFDRGGARRVGLIKIESPLFHDVSYRNDNTKLLQIVTV
jgi:hypothetical protein